MYTQGITELALPDKLAAYCPLLHFTLCHQGCFSCVPALPSSEPAHQPFGVFRRLHAGLTIGGDQRAS